MRYTVSNTIDAGKPVNVFVNGNKISGAIIADTKRGEVIFAPEPLRTHKTKKDEIYYRKLRGIVTVEPLT